MLGALRPMECAESAFARAFRPIVLVDGCEWGRAAVAAAALDAGFLPRTAARAGRALVQLAMADECIDALVVPLCLGEVPSRELAREARRLRPSLPIVFVDCDSRPGAELEPGGSRDPITRVVCARSPESVCRAIEDLVAGRTDEGAGTDPDAGA